jgi:carbon monoxide dehydrogenase subunit G
MPSVRVQHDYEVPADELWSRIGDFHDLSTWHPAIESQTAEGGEQVRELHLGDGGTVVETLVDEGPRTYTYRIDESPQPVADYVATISVQDADGGSLVTWVADFRTVGTTDDEAVAIIEGIFTSGLDAL